VDLAEAVAVLVAGILASGVADRLVPVAPGWQASIDGILVSMPVEFWFFRTSRAVTALIDPAYL